MPKTLNLAQQLKEQLSQESETIRSLTKKQLGDMGRELNIIYQQELNTIATDTRALSQHMSSLVLRTWLWVFLTIMITLAASSGLLWWQGQTLAKNAQQISQQNAQLAELALVGGKLVIHDCGGRMCIAKAVYEENWTAGEIQLFIPKGY